MWLYKNEEFNIDNAEGYFGFVYLITNNKTGRKYIGKKFFTKAGTRQVKGKKKKIRKTSDWESYWGSNTELQTEIKQNGEEQYTREILHLCKSRSECSYMETWEIFNCHALLSDSFFNSWVTCKIHKSHVIGKLDGSQISKQRNNNSQNK